MGPSRFSHATGIGARSLGLSIRPTRETSLMGASATISPSTRATLASGTPSALSARIRFSASTCRLSYQATVAPVFSGAGRIPSER